MYELRQHLSAACGGTSPQGEAWGRLPLRGKPAKRRQRRNKRAGFEEAARLAGPSGPGNRFAATVWLSAKLTERWNLPQILHPQLPKARLRVEVSIVYYDKMKYML